MTKAHSMNHCTCHFEISFFSAPPRMEQMTHLVAEARQNQVTTGAAGLLVSYWEQKNREKQPTITVLSSTPHTGNGRTQTMSKQIR